jgi:hypothetical protein
MSQRLTTKHNETAEGDFWVTPSGRRLPFVNMNDRQYRRVLRAIADGDAPCHADKRCQIAGLARRVGVGAPLTVRDGDMAHMLAGLEEAAVAGGLDGLEPLHDWLEENYEPRPDDFLYALRVMRHLDVVPLLFSQPDGGGDEDLIESADASYWVVGAAGGNDEDWSDKEEEYVPTPRGGTGKAEVRGAVAYDDPEEPVRSRHFKKTKGPSPEQSLMCRRLERCEVHAVTFAFVSETYKEGAVPLRRRVNEMKRDLALLSPQRSFGQVAAFTSFNEMVAAFAAAMWRLREFVPGV